MKKDSFMKDALILFAITLVAGICLGGVYEITKEPIAEAKMEAKSAAFRVVYEEADKFKELDEMEANVLAAAEVLGGKDFGNVLVEEAVAALDASGNEIGYVVTSTSKDGYGGNITITVGISADGTVQGIEFLTLAETAGLGMNAANPEFKGQFTGKNVESFAVVKGGAAAEHEIDAMSGATVTSSAVANAVNAAICFVNDVVGQ